MKRLSHDECVPLRQLVNRLAVAVRGSQSVGLVMIEPDLGLPGSGAARGFEETMLL
jgi:hypothetical protein